MEAPNVKRPHGSWGIPSVNAPYKGLDVAAWIAENVTSAEATSAPERRYFQSRMHHRVEKVVRGFGMTDAMLREVRKQSRDAAAAVHDANVLHV